MKVASTMAERSFSKEIEKLRLGDGEEFRGEGILAVTKALLQSGVGYVGGYPGAPISHLMDVLSDARGLLDELGVQFVSNASEAAAAAMLAASVNYPVRGAVTWKSTVGTNVASDALANLASGGVTGGALIIVGEDYGEGSSILQERSHAFAMKSQMWLLDPRPRLSNIVEAVERGFELSEASHTPVMLELRIRACHLYGRFRARSNRPPTFSVQDALDRVRRDVSRIALPPASFEQEREKIEQRWPAAIEFIRSRRMNEFVDGSREDLGIIVQGGLYNALLRALELAGVARPDGSTDLPIYVLNVTYPLIDDEVVRFCAGKRAVLVVEEGQPEFIEQALNSILRQADAPTKLVGKAVLPRAGEYTGPALLRGIERFLGQHAPAIPRAPAASRATGTVSSTAAALEKALPPRPVGFCTGCPERPIFAAMKLLQRETGPLHVSCDIGCHLFSILPPFHIGNTTMGYGLGAAGAAGLRSTRGKRPFAVMGDGGFWHNGLTSGVGNAVFNRSDQVLVVVDNGYAAATGGQDVPSSRTPSQTRSTRHPIATAVQGVGVDWVRVVDHTYDVATMRDALRAAVASPGSGPKVVIAASECMLNRQRRENPLRKRAIAAGERVALDRFGVDADVCTGDHSCIRLSGCPSLTIKPRAGRPPAATVDRSCVGCGLCGELADTAALCPSFYRMRVLHNPTRWERLRVRVSGAIIGWLQRRATVHRLRHAF